MLGILNSFHKNVKKKNSVAYFDFQRSFLIRKAWLKIFFPLSSTAYSIDTVCEGIFQRQDKHGYLKAIIKDYWQHSYLTIKFMSYISKTANKAFCESGEWTGLDNARRGEWWAHDYNWLHFQLFNEITAVHRLCEASFRPLFASKCVDYWATCDCLQSLCSYTGLHVGQMPQKNTTETAL